MDNIYSDVGAHSVVVPLRSPDSSVQEDVTSIAREVTPNWNGAQDYMSGSPLMVSAFHLPEESTYSQSRQSPYATSSCTTPEGNYAEEQILNSPNTLRSGSQISYCLQRSPKQSLYETASVKSSVDFSEHSGQAALPRSPVEQFEDSAQKALLRSPAACFEYSAQAALIRSPVGFSEDSTQTAPLRPPVDFFEDSVQATPLASDSYPSSSHSQTLPADVLTGEIATIKRGAQECQEPQKKRRGRKPKSEEEKAAALEKRRGNRSRVRVYEIRQPFDDKEMERKRINAVNSKKHRDQQKQLVKEMEKQLADASIEREIMKQKNEELRKDLDNTLRQLGDTISERDILKQEKEDLYRKLNAALTQIATIQRRYSVQSLPV
ncbi:putative uncharacterized protein DDB_G0271982 isoform X2 [Palaemon carinicauda]|uniref:putative uncharacterized protein DDB_G0271982 isoform X2 n=1 Tax=Palaemon carinicauda TaxID=392227 RepID=UPI0035B660FE